ncbi:helix-turn-helix domain-containing protein [Clostridium manihotivorum]|uniref:XRE family transcriptional regulator n=1 Tax=Clostridium manihotivorum TaxID=2320868 RepID=A0A3R5QRT1_9CLOT|nr:helix-turn-helix transcriptional regulator [Clostridium manihotivorum]QAA31214.1 XRE family transcriptional regulator [Clostridium manihotivorum]
MDGSILKKLRNEKKLTQEQLGALIGKSDSAIRMYEAGKRDPSFETLKLISEVLNVSIEYLLTGNNENESKTSSIVSKIIDQLIANDVITDSDSIDKEVEEMIMFAVRTEIDKKLKNKDQED